VCEAVEAKLRAAVKTGQIPAQGEDKIAYALKQRVITQVELELMSRMKSLRRRVIMVDDFSPDFTEVSIHPEDILDIAPLSQPDIPAETGADTIQPMENS
jgi:acyl-CoA dehydrogenase